MTCRSSLSLAALGLALFSGRADAQGDTLRVAQPAGDRTHIVQTGETLWALAEQYLGDALLWPAIYRLNTEVVEDPHWIYPGEELRLGPPGAMGDSVGMEAAEPRADTVGVGVGLAGDTIAGQPVGDTAAAIERPNISADMPPPPPPEGSGTIFSRRARSQSKFSGRIGATEFRPLLSGTFYGAGFLTEGESFPWATVLGAAGKVTLGRLTGVTSARVFESVEIKTPGGASYHIGDSLLVAVESRNVPGWGRIILPTAIARVREVSERRAVADILSQWSRVASDQVAMPLEPFKAPGSSPPVPIENGMTGRVIAMRDLHQLNGEQSILFIDRGREDGVSLGDVFEVLRPNPPEASPETPLRQVALLQIVHLRTHSASGIVVRMADLGVDPGVPVRLIRKMPS